MWQQALDAVTAAGVVLVVIQLRQSQRQRHRQFEDLYIARYWAILDEMADTSVCADPLPDKIAISYFRLCEDQAEMRRAGWITNETWTLWCDGMWLALSTDALRPAWDRLSLAFPTSYPLLRCLRETGVEFDPCELRAPLQWVRGIWSPLDRLARRDVVPR